ncbi:putative methyltransferase [Cercospora beticola]|uniref:Putative methyltransferase n=1 Tax=Cercospora beticola TaxID=122368 RepID=A0A2G5I4P7_CERBT|nr:putative methyltransferase [Cercospora beticola]PIA99721.1 putative methyltransferase [Cercospora beticola]WPB00477.1 hypothetical protein RHO25_005097 [Cercospora beticola]CAK1361308.1 unnamed protein product [Cercospora beticola]
MGNLCSNAKNNHSSDPWDESVGDGWPRNEQQLQEEYRRYFKRKDALDGDDKKFDREDMGFGAKGKKKTKAETHCGYMIATISELARAKQINVKNDETEDRLRILDVGCGSGEITVDVAEMFPEAQVVGLDVSAAMLESAKVYAERRGVKNLEFVKGSVFDLEALKEQGKFNVAYTHQVVAHLPDPVSGLKEMVEVVRTGGAICLREGDLRSGRFWPDGEYDELQECFRTIIKVHEGNGGTTDAGRKLKSWLKEAGIIDKEILTSTNVTSYDSPEGRREYGGHWPGRCTQGLFADRAMDMGVSSETLEKWAMAWKDWIEDEDAAFAMMHGEVIARVT